MPQATEFAPKAIKDMWPIIDKAYKSAQFSGILSGGSYGYHVSRNRLKRLGKTGDYSIQAAADKEGDGDAGSAIDISLNDAEMELATRRLLLACLDKDPRVQGKMREFFGTLDGRKVTGYSPYRGRHVSADSSHLWHIHISIHRKYCEDAAVCRGIAEVMAGIKPGSSGGGGDVPEKWDGKSFPGRDAFKLGHRHDAVTLLGQRLVAHGYGKYKVGPGPNFTEVDLAGVKAFQLAQGWTGADADGYPGPETWKRLMAAPKPKPPAKPAVDLSKLIAAAKADPGRKQGGTTSGAADDVKLVESALRIEGLLSAKYAGDGSFGSLTVEAYAAWQRKCGYRGKDADGIPGKASLQKLGAKHGFNVKD